MKVVNITNIELNSLLIVFINLSILIAVVNIVALIKNRLNSGELHLPTLTPYQQHSHFSIFRRLR